jgi:hypothetical protein
MSDNCMIVNNEFENIRKEASWPTLRYRTIPASRDGEYHEIHERFETVASRVKIRNIYLLRQVAWCPLVLKESVIQISASRRK